MHNTLQSITGSALSALSKGGRSVQDDDGFGGTLRRARARVPRADEPLYAEGGEFENHPWWETPFLEPLSVDGKRTAHDKYSPDVPLWESVSHYALMSLAVRNLVKALERNAGGEKIGDSYVRILTVTQLRAAAEKAMEKSLMDVAELKLKRMGEPRVREHENVRQVIHFFFLRVLARFAGRIGVLLSPIHVDVLWWSLLSDISPLLFPTTATQLPLLFPRGRVIRLLSQWAFHTQHEINLQTTDVEKLMKKGGRVMKGGRTMTK